VVDMILMIQKVSVTSGTLLTHFGVDGTEGMLMGASGECE
jgi:hypothetical protein